MEVLNFLNYVKIKTLYAMPFIAEKNVQPKLCYAT